VFRDHRPVYYYKLISYLALALALSVLASDAGRLFSFASVGVSTGVLERSWQNLNIGYRLPIRLEQLLQNHITYHH
jgi:hypothetical protein